MLKSTACLMCVSNYCWYDTFTVLCSILRTLPYRVMLIYIRRTHCQVKSNFVFVWKYLHLDYKSTFYALTGEWICLGNCWGAAAYLEAVSESCKSAWVQKSFRTLLLSCQQRLFLQLDGNPCPSQSHFWTQSNSNEHPLQTFRLVKFKSEPMVCKCHFQMNIFKHF